MKAKYYPHITAAGALLLTAAPLCFVLSLNSLASPHDNFDMAMADPVLDGRAEAEGRVYVPLEPELPGSIALETGGSTPEENSPLPEPATTDTRVAMLPDRSIPAATLPVSEPPPVMSDAAAVMDMAMLSEPDQGIVDERVVVEPADVPMPDTSVPVLTESTSSDEPSSMLVTIPGSPVVKTLVDAGSHFGATAHLAMREGFRDYGRDAKESQMVASSMDKMEDELTMTGDADGGLSRKSRGSINDLTSLMNPGAGSTPPESGFGKAPESVLEDVILQQPLESRAVTRVENIVAVTKAKGWPIALVRSDLPDDHWWVQQMVGIRGNAFAARANFGNENSIRGSVYHLVFVFLDSPDEVRRFRIAKQFKELPEGVRRSREFTFTRR